MSALHEEAGAMPWQERARTAHEYAETVFHRGRVPMEPVNFQPNWHDQPSKHKTYLGVPRLPLPGDLPDLGPVGDVLAGDAAMGDSAPATWTLESVSTLLRLSYGLLDRRLRIGWNQDIDDRIHYDQALWGRGTASGGGMYPLETYWVTGGSGPVVPGVYHYSTAHHALERLLTGDVSGRVRAALGADPGTDQFLLVTVRFWKNSYKYNSFCYHVVTQDAGAMLGAWELLARGLGRPLHRVLWFADEALGALLGLETLEESVLAVVPLPWAGGPVPARPAGPAERLVDRPFFERSREILRFEQTERVHLATLLDEDEAHTRPVAVAGSALIPAAATAETYVPLPPPVPGDRELGEVLRSRRSSFGAFTARPPLRLEELGTVLSGASSARRYSADVKAADAPLTRLYVLANRVTGLDPGTYAYDADDHRLATIAGRDLGTFLQRAYYLTNYNLDQVAAVVAIAAKLDSALELFGSRGYRVLNLEVGAVAQTAYVAACAAGVGCGAVLGFDNIAIDESVGLDREDERTFLFLLLGHERTDTADFDYRLV
jgi:SagB-type dehydrogenase family enzyme